MEKEEKVILKHFSHDQHPLTLVESHPREQCYGCGKYFSGEEAYRCNEEHCNYHKLLHEECAEMPRQIWHPMHPKHKLEQKTYDRSIWGVKCAVCELYMYIPLMLAYGCDICKVWMHLECAVGSKGVIKAADDHEDKEKARIRHPSHPQHELKLLRRPKRSCSFKCDACGTIGKGNPYVCMHENCQLMIHENCASMDTTILIESRRHHRLSLAFHLPIEYIKFWYDCCICQKALLLKYWVYHCGTCRYVVHIKCAVETSLATTSNSTNINAVDDDFEGVIKFPINDVSEELIKPFVTRGGRVNIPTVDELIINGKYKFHSHHHQLTLISSEGRDYDDDDDCPHSELICDACITPIYQSSSSSSSSHKQYFYYMSCDECKYFLHLACFYLPQQLHSHPLHNKHQNKPLKLQTSPKLGRVYCSVCAFPMSDLYYGCTTDQCDFKVDIKCASLPDTLKHAAHSKHRFHLKLYRRNDYGYFVRISCYACGDGIDTDEISYSCDNGEYDLHVRCVLLPARSKHRWEKHPLPLTYDASKDHPTDFYCASCEREMNPRWWMYHCSECDQSFHPKCVPTARGDHKNIKFGQQYTISTCHDPLHPLTYQLITLKLHCDLCGRSRHGSPGFQSASCNFVMCLLTCGRKHKAAIK